MQVRVRVLAAESCKEEIEHKAFRKSFMVQHRISLKRFNSNFWNRILRNQIFNIKVDHQLHVHL